jgi:hypothetical protein
VRQDLEMNGAVLPQLEEDEEGEMEFLQIRALRAQMGNAFRRDIRIAGATIRLLFGFTTMRMRYTVLRIKFGMSLDLAK